MAGRLTAAFALVVALSLITAGLYLQLIPLYRIARATAPPDISSAAAGGTAAVSGEMPSMAQPAAAAPAAAQQQGYQPPELSSVSAEVGTSL